MRIQDNISLKAYNTFGIDVLARRFISVGSIDDIKKISSKGMLKEHFLILGGGSNVLFTADFDGVVIHNNIQGIEMTRAEGDFVLIKAGAGVNWNDLVWYCIDKGYGGIENLSLIPGSVGAGPIQNIGAYGVELKDHFECLEAYDILTGNVKTYLKDECRFGYRDSIFKHELKGKVIILSVTLRLNKNGIPDTSYGAINDQLARMGITGQPDIGSVGLAVNAIREAKLPDPEVTGNAGSFFKNPVIHEAEFLSLQEKYPEMPYYTVAEKMFKVPAGWLIEQCGWKGRRQGRAGVHDMQALVLINHGNAGGEEILSLAENIKISVYNKFHIELEMEVNIV
jgi:UDP-N-acetylmuramate dehydrogenase